MQVTLESLKTMCEGCDKCALSQTRTKVVFGRGCRTPDILLIGEAPGKNEDLQGEPFVGAAGQTLDELLTKCGINPSKIYIANVLKCRPPRNRTPTATEENMCGGYLKAQIELLGPKIIVCLGATATNFITGEIGGITRRRGKMITVNGRPVLPTFHPAAAIYDKTKLPLIEQDLRLAQAIVNQINANA
jgi:DNA polymerase